MLSVIIPLPFSSESSDRLRLLTVDEIHLRREEYMFFDIYHSTYLSSGSSEG
jgi:hypothetical protein